MVFDVDFISHMVQMKRSGGKWARPSLPTFISHMVQMKLSGCDPIADVYNLYIPHGSDETRNTLAI